MRKISPHFYRKEFACPCGCGADTVDAELLELLEAIRERFGPVFISSGFRCFSQNARVKGAKKSFHTQGKAADIILKGATPGEVAQWLNTAYPDRYAVIEYPRHVHIDVREMPYRMKSHYK